MTVSVALPVFNGGSYLAAQLDSILSQLEEADELVVSYQPSSDDSWQLLQSYCRRDDRVKVIVNERTGITANFQCAIAHCTGSYIFLSDQDDVWLPDKRRQVLEAFQHTGADLVIHDAVHTDADLIPRSQTFFQQYSIGPGRVKNIVKPRMSGCCMAFTRALQAKLLPLPEIYGYDQWIAVLAEFTGHIAYLDQVLLLHRIHGDNSTSTTRPLPVVLRCRSRLIGNLILRLVRIARDNRHS